MKHIAWVRQVTKVGMAMTGMVVLAAVSAAQGISCQTLGPQCAQAFTDISFGACQIGRVAQAGIMPGCGGGQFCPNAAVTRGEMAVFLENARHLYSPFTLSQPIGRFADVPTSFPLACWIEELYRDGITAGCSLTPPLYCPDSPVNRAQMAVFILKTTFGSTHVPPACPNPPTFADVPCSSPFAPWIYELVSLCITAGCGGGNYCPDASITRSQMAVFLWNAFLRSPQCTTPCTACGTCS